MKNYLITFAVALLLGIALTVVGINYLNKGPDFAKGVMSVTLLNVSALKDNVKQNRCAPTDTIPHFQTMRYVANDIEAAFGEMPKNDQFVRYASDYRAALDETMASPPASCPAVQAALSKIGKACENCHRDYND